MSIALEYLDPNAIELTHEEIRRYSRHLIMPEVGLRGQRKLKAASVLLVGTGGLGSPLAMYLAAAGVGWIGLVDYDVVDASNLQRQVLHGTASVGNRKSSPPANGFSISTRTPVWTYTTSCSRRTMRSTSPALTT